MMKPDSSEFTGVTPLHSSPATDGSVDWQIDLLDREPDLRFDALRAGNVVIAETHIGRLACQITELGRCPWAKVMPGTEGEQGTVLASLRDGDTIRLQGASAGGSLLKLGGFAVGSHAAFGYFADNPLDAATIDSFYVRSGQGLSFPAYIQKLLSGELYTRDAAGQICERIAIPALSGVVSSLFVGHLSD